jgi:hypothetical protein
VSRALPSGAITAAAHHSPVVLYSAGIEAVACARTQTERDMERKNSGSELWRSLFGGRGMLRPKRVFYCGGLRQGRSDESAIALSAIVSRKQQVAIRNVNRLMGSGHGNRAMHEVRGGDMGSVTATVN